MLPEALGASRGFTRGRRCPGRNLLAPPTMNWGIGVGWLGAPSRHKAFGRGFKPPCRSPRGTHENAWMGLARANEFTVGRSTGPDRYR
jgi:hypothetical protein